MVEKVAEEIKIPMAEYTSATFASATGHAKNSTLQATTLDPQESTFNSTELPFKPDAFYTALNNACAIAMKMISDEDFPAVKVDLQAVKEDSELSKKGATSVETKGNFSSGAEKSHHGRYRSGTLARDREMRSARESGRESSFGTYS